LAFNFLGTLSSPQLQDLRSFLEEQIVDINEEINYLYVEMNNLRQTLSYFSTADNFFGGSASNVLYETQLHDLVKVTKQDDSVSADLMSQVKQPFISTIKYKRERNEYKMKKLLDAIEQSKEMIDRKSAAKTETKSFLDQIERMIADDNNNILFPSEQARKDFAKGVVKTESKT
jgi:hypothetical protein